MQGRNAPSRLVLPRWVHQAACRGVSTDLFFDRGHDHNQQPLVGKQNKGRRPVSRENAEKRAAAKAICARCPVLAECRELFLDEPHGVFGGLDKEERIDLRRARSAIAHEGIDPRELGRETFERFLAGESLLAIAKSHGLRTAQLRSHLEDWLRTPEGLRAQLENEIRKAWERELTDREIAFELSIPVPKVIYLRRKLGLLKRPVSQAPDMLPSNERYTSAVKIRNHVYPANYLGEVEDGSLLFMQVKYHQAATRRWMRPEEVLLGKEVRRHIVSKGVGRARDRERDAERERQGEDQAEVA